MPDTPVLAACPVCTWPQPDVAACGRCGTVLRGGYLAGVPTPQDQQACADRLAAQQRHYDLRAAVLAAAVPGRRCDPGLLSAMMSLCRGDAAGVLPETETDGLIDGLSGTQEDSAVGIGFPLARLTAGETAAIHFLQIGPDGIAVETLALDADGVPRRVAGVAAPWHELVPGLPGDDHSRRRFQLAGGVGTEPPADPATLAAAVPAAAARAAQTLLRSAAAGLGTDDEPWGVPAASADLVLVRRTAGWPLLEDAARTVREAEGPAAEIVDLGGGTLPQVVDRIARRAPLRYEYTLFLAASGPHGTVVPDPFPLFRAGSVVKQDDWPHERLDVRAVFPGARQLLLPVLARTGAEQAEWKEVGRAIVDARHGATVTVQVRLDGPGAVTFRAPPALASDDGLPQWPDLLRGLPGRAPGATATDLVVLVEVGGDAGEARTRLDLLDAVLDAASHPDLRVAVVGYRDHYVEARRPVFGTLLDTVERSRAWSAQLRRWEPDRGGPGRVGDDNAAPLEDALDWVAAQGMGWRPRARHLLLTIGRRPPHPPAVNDRAPILAMGCPSGIDWRKALGALRQEQGLECFAVVPAASGLRDEDTDRVWQLIGTAGRFDMATASAHGLVRTLELITGAGPQWCLAERADSRR